MKWWQQLDPKQRKVVMAAGAGLALAVVVLATRGRSAPADTAPGVEAGSTSDPYASTGEGAVPSSFADNGAGFGQLSTAISDGLGTVQTSLDSVSGSLSDHGARLTAVESAATSAAAAAEAARAAASEAAQKPPAQLATTGRGASRLTRDARRRDTNPRKPGLQLNPRDTNPRKPGLQRNKRDKDPTRPGIQRKPPPKPKRRR